MNRSTIGLIVTLVLGTLAAPLAADAQQPAKVPRIGVLLPGRHEPSPSLDAFRQGLRELGYVEGQNIAIEYRYAEGKLNHLPDLATDLVRLKVDVIVTATTPGIQAAKQVTNTIPIVIATASDPVKSGLVASLARPGGNITGLSGRAADLSGKRLELFTGTLPQLSRVAILWNSANAAMSHRYGETEAAAQALGVSVQSLEVRGDPSGFEPAFSALTSQPPEGLIVTLDPFTIRHRRQIAELAAKHQLPAMYEQSEFVHAGGLMSYGPSIRDHYRRAASYVDKILKGAMPADLPIEQPMRFELVINLKTAKALGLTIPPSILFQADEVIR